MHPSTAGDLRQLVYFRGRVAMAAILRGLGVRSGDEVLIQAFTCIAVPEAVLSVGAVPRYVDVAPGTPNMDPSDLAQRIGPQARAVVVQHSFGLPADVVRLGEVAANAGIPVIEDCAHTIASRVDGRPVGSFGAAAFYSYEASKPVFIGIGGSAIANDPELHSAILADRSYYSEPSTATQLQIAAMRLAHRVVYRPSTYWKVRSVFRAMVAAGVIRGNYNEVASESGASEDFRRGMGARQRRALDRALQRLTGQTAHRRWVADQYRTRIAAAGVAHIDVAPGADPVYGRYPMLVENKREWVNGARDAKVELADFYDTVVHPLRGEGLRKVGYEPGSCPNAEWVSGRVVSLPTAVQVDASQIERAVRYFNG